MLFAFDAPNLGRAFFFPLGEGDGCAQLDWMNSEKLSAHVFSMKNGDSHKMT